MTFLRHNELTIALPHGWTEASEVIGIVALDRPQPGFRPTMVVSRDRAGEGETVSAFAARQLPLLRGALVDYTLLSEGPLRAGAQDGFGREHSFTSGTSTVQQLQWSVVHGTTAYTFTFSDVPAYFAETRPRAIELLATVSFKDSMSPV